MVDESKTVVGGVGTKAESKTTGNKTEKVAEKRAGKATKSLVKKKVKKPEKKSTSNRSSKTEIEQPVKVAKETQVSGVEKLRLAADQALFKITDKVVQKLESNAMLGMMDSTKWLVALADKRPVKKRGAETEFDPLAWLARLAAEPDLKELVESGVIASPRVEQM